MRLFFDEAQVEIALVELFEGLGFDFAFEPVRTMAAARERQRHLGSFVGISHLPERISERRQAHQFNALH